MTDPALDATTSTAGDAYVHAAETPHQNRRGQRLGDKGQRTRTSILVATLEMLATMPLADVTMAEVTKRLGLNAAAFYRYFADIGEVLVAAYACVTEEAERLTSLIERDWSHMGADAAALELADAYFKFWRRHAPLLQARNALADAGDARFVLCRRQLAEPLAQALAGKLQGVEEPDLASPIALASLLIMALEHAAAVSAHPVYRSERPWPGLRLALAEMIAAAVARRG